MSQTPRNEKCTLCGSPAFIMFTGVECSNRDCPNFKLEEPTIEEIKDNPPKINWGDYNQVGNMDLGI